MKTAMIVFIIVSCAFSVFAILYVIGDWIFEKLKRGLTSEPQKEPAPEPVPEPAPEPAPEPEPVPEPKPAPEPIRVVEHITAEEADELLSDEQAMEYVIEELGPKTEGYRDYINLGVINAHFEPGSRVTLEELQAKKLVSDKVKRIKILADGELDRSLTVVAHSFSIQAVKMIGLTGGTVIRKR